MNKYSNYTNILGLGQQRQMPSGLYTQEKTVKQEEKDIAKLQFFYYERT
jgi:hypothetical protein